jgi:hypothetical protein
VPEVRPRAPASEEFLGFGRRQAAVFLHPRTRRLDRRRGEETVVRLARADDERPDHEVRGDQQTRGTYASFAPGPPWNRRSQPVPNGTTAVAASGENCPLMSVSAANMRDAPGRNGTSARGLGNRIRSSTRFDRTNATVQMIDERRTLVLQKCSKRATRRGISSVSSAAKSPLCSAFRSGSDGTRTRTWHITRSRSECSWCSADAGAAVRRPA